MRHRKRSNIIIELTPLLDVIMIMIFIIMTNNSNKVIEAEAATDRAKTNAAKAAKEYEAMISEKALEYSAALEKLSSELENVRVSAEETEAAKDAEIEKLTEDLAIAEARLDLTENLRELVNQNADKISGYDSLIKVVKVFNINLRFLIDQDDYFIEELRYNYSGDRVTVNEKRSITILHEHNNPEAKKENDKTWESEKNNLSYNLNRCLDDFIKTQVPGDDGSALYIVFSTEETIVGTNNALTDRIKELINSDKYRDYNINLVLPNKKQN
ncbi:MAG: hypothetical protein IKS11_08300 [Lachnospiraceae bacterium]|nr:hypothetical protein [Lachnospiraceae bacterium]